MVTVLEFEWRNEYFGYVLMEIVADQDEEVKTKSGDGDAKMTGDGQKAGRPKRDRIPTSMTRLREYVM